tara:strand:- start:168 stop:479 length:312 start_codon:yes stop_codon:yes gene_type:complete
MTWLAVISAGFVTYFTRFSMITFVNSKMLSAETKKVLSYVPSSVFPAIIFPAIFFDDTGLFVSIYDPKIIGGLAAIIVGFFSKNIISTISVGLIIYWLFIFVI